jgi:hypothetical protein
VTVAPMAGGFSRSRSLKPVPIAKSVPSGRRTSKAPSLVAHDDRFNTISNLPYKDFQSNYSPTVGVAVFSLGKDGAIGNNGDSLYKNGSIKSDDIVSWQ